MAMTDGLGTLRVDEDARVERLAAAKGLVLMPLLSNEVDNVWQPEAVEGLAMGPDDRKNQFVVNLLSQLEAAKAGGVVVDWEELDPARKKEITDLLIKMADALHAVDKELWVEIQMGDEFNVLDLERLAEHADHYIAMLYDETSDIDPPGPIASQDWFEGWLHVLAGYGEPDLWIGAIGAYGYDWTEGKKRAETISFADAMSRASYSRAYSGSIPRRRCTTRSIPTRSRRRITPSASWTPSPSLINSAPSATRSWAALPSAASARRTRKSGMSWPSRTPKTRCRKRSKARDHMTPPTRSPMSARAKSSPWMTPATMATREVKLEDNGRYSVAYSSDFPTYPESLPPGRRRRTRGRAHLRRRPRPEVDTADSRHPQSKYNVKATFFLVGQPGGALPGLVKRIVDEGHEIGNHTYTHPNLARDPAKQIQLELNATQLLIESITGRSTTLFRPPYNADSRPTSLDGTDAPQALRRMNSVTSSSWRTSIRRIGRDPAPM